MLVTNCLQKPWPWVYMDLAINKPHVIRKHNQRKTRFQFIAYLLLPTLFTFPNASLLKASLIYVHDFIDRLLLLDNNVNARSGLSSRDSQRSTNFRWRDIVGILKVSCIPIC